MDIRYKLYPYPVLSNYSDDYINSSFDSAIEVKREGYNIVISVVSEIKNPELEALIKEGKAAFVYHLECAQTGYRTVISTANTDKLVSISEDKVCGRLQICPFIVACADIPDYVNSCFNEDYRGYKFQIEAGCVMAVGKQVNCDIDKERNDLVSAKSIFVVTKIVFKDNPCQSYEDFVIAQMKADGITSIAKDAFSGYLRRKGLVLTATIPFEFYDGDGLRLEGNNFVFG